MVFSEVVSTRYAFLPPHYSAQAPSCQAITRRQSAVSSGEPCLNQLLTEQVSTQQKDGKSGQHKMMASKALRRTKNNATASQQALLPSKQVIRIGTILLATYLV